MQRREFIKYTGAVATISSLIPGMGLKAFSQRENPNISQKFVLRGFTDEQEEAPSLVSDGNGNLWMFSLRRVSYPEDTEVVSAFRYFNNHWIETDPVTRTKGKFESPTAACAPKGHPVLAWTEINSNKWIINVARFAENGFEKPAQLQTQNGRSINPVLIAPDTNRNWIAWENFYNGKLRICISKYENSKWTRPFVLSKGENSCFDPAIAEANNGDLYIAYGITNGYHQDIEMSIIDGNSFKIKKTVPIAVGGYFNNRVNLNTNPALVFDSADRLWISFESNRDAKRLQDGDNYTGDRCCAILSYQDGKIFEPEKSGKWLFSGKNDHKPTFVKDRNEQTYISTHCGGNFEDNPFWQYRLSWLDTQKGWIEPVTILSTSQKGALVPPALNFDKNNELWLATCFEKQFINSELKENKNSVNSRLSQLSVLKLSTPKIIKKPSSLAFRETNVTGLLPDQSKLQISGHPKTAANKITHYGDSYTLLYGNMHEHSNISSCWPAGTDGTLHDDYRFGLFSEGYDFVAITDHGYALNEVSWRKNIRLSDFYNDPPYFVALPAMEWTLTTGKNKDIGSVYGAGHYNVIFASSNDARKFIRNSHEVYNRNTPETKDVTLLWDLLDKKEINCVTIPHHPADEVHPVDWSVYNKKYVPVVELFQCRGNAEYPGCPREINLARHRPHKSPKGFVNYALKEKKYKMGFIASGDHNSMGVGAAALWVKEFSRAGILEALRNKRCFATTGDKMTIDFSLNDALAGSTIKINAAPNLSIKVVGQRELAKVEVLRNSEVIKSFQITDGRHLFNHSYIDEEYQSETQVLYYYVRVMQQNDEIGWSSPIWVKQS